MADDEQAVSTGGEDTPADEGHGEQTPTDGDAGESDVNDDDGQPSKPKGGGFDDIPEHAKEIIKRQTGKAKAAERRAMEAEAKAAALESLASQRREEKTLDEETRARVEEFKKLAPEAGYVSKQEVDQLVSEKLSAIERQQQAERDREDLKATLSKFNGKEMPKITVDEIQDFLEEAARDPSLQHWTAPSVPFEAIARQVKQREIQQMEVDRLLKSGGVTPPNVEKGPDGKKAPRTSVPRFDNMAEMQAHLKSIG